MELSGGLATSVVDRLRSGLGSGEPSGERLRLLSADDHTFFRQGLRLLFAAQPRWCVVGEASNAEQLLLLARQLRPHVVLVNLRLPGGAIDAISRLQAEFPEIEVVISGFAEDEAELQLARRAGVRYCFLKSWSFARLLAILSTIVDLRSALTDRRIACTA